MVLYDANNVMTLVKNQWTLNTFTATSTNPVNGGPLTFNENLNTQTIPATTTENFINGDFETGQFNTGSPLYFGWGASYCTIQTDVVYSGTYAVLMNDGALGALIGNNQNWSILVSTIVAFGFYYKGSLATTGAYVKISFSDLTTVFYYPPLVANWTYFDILALIGPAYPTKTLVAIQLCGGAAGAHSLYIDAFTLQTPLAPAILPQMRLQIDEYDPMHPEYQMVFINRPERITPVAPNVIKHEQTVGVEFFMKLNNYLPDDIESVWRPLILAVKNELTRIMNVYRFNGIAAGATLNHSDWRDSKFSHGFSGVPDPINFATTMTVEIIWYESLSGDEIGMRISALDIFGSSLLGLLDMTWTDTDPWVKLQVPKGPLLEQHLVGPHIEGRFTCHDWKHLYTLLYNTAIPENLSYKAINTDGSKTAFGTNPANPEFVVYIQDQNNNTDGFQFVNVRIQRVELSQASVLGIEPINWTVYFMADYLYPIPPIL